MNKNCLIVDDCEDLQNILKICVNKTEIFKNVYTANNGLKALDIIKENKINMIITDLMMPEMNGWDFINKLEEKNYFSNCSLIVISACDNIKKSMFYNEKNIDLFIKKPFRLDSICKSILQIL